MRNAKKTKPEWPEAFHYVNKSKAFDPPSLFAKALSKTIPIREDQTRLLDIGCGSGIIGIYSRQNRQVPRNYSSFPCQPHVFDQKAQ